MGAAPPFRNQISRLLVCSSSASLSSAAMASKISASVACGSMFSPPRDSLRNRSESHPIPYPRHHCLLGDGSPESHDG